MEKAKILKIGLNPKNPKYKKKWQYYVDNHEELAKCIAFWRIRGDAADRSGNLIGYREAMYFGCLLMAITYGNPDQRLRLAKNRVDLETAFRVYELHIEAEEEKPKIILPGQTEFKQMDLRIELYDDFRGFRKDKKEKE